MTVASQPVFVIDPDLEQYAGSILNAFGDGLRTVVILLPWRSAPEKYQRIDGSVRAFACSPDVYEELLAIDPACPTSEQCYSLLESIMNGSIAVDRILVRQLPYETPTHSPHAAATSVIMAHRGRIAHLRTSLHYLSRASGANVLVRVGLDAEAPSDYAQLRDEHPETEFYSLQPTPLGPYVIRQELATRSNEPLMAFHDSDDISCSDRFSMLYSEMDRTGAQLVGCHELRVDELTREVIAIRFPLDASEGLRRCYGHALLHPTSMVTREGFFQAGGFSTNLPISSDTQFLLRCYFKLQIRNADGFGYIRRRHPAA